MLPCAGHTAGATERRRLPASSCETPSCNAKSIGSRANTAGVDPHLLTGRLRGDQVESFLYHAPQSFSYQWLRNGKPIAGRHRLEPSSPTRSAPTVPGHGHQLRRRQRRAEPERFAVKATVELQEVTYNRKKGTATLRVAVTGSGRLDLYGKGVANARGKTRGHRQVVVRASGKARIKLKNTGKARVKATISYTPEGGKAIKRSRRSC